MGYVTRFCTQRHRFDWRRLTPTADISNSNRAFDVSTRLFTAPIACFSETSNLPTALIACFSETASSLFPTDCFIRHFDIACLLQLACSRSAPSVPAFISALCSVHA